MLLKHVFNLKLALLGCTPIAAWAADEIIHRQNDLSSIRLWTWGALLAFSLLGWAIVHLDEMIEWFPKNAEQSYAEKLNLIKSRLGIIKNFLASFSAGIAWYLLAISVPNWVGVKFDMPEFVLLVGTTPAAMGGTLTWQWIASKLKA